jgi:hypothetical protein
MNSLCLSVLYTYWKYSEAEEILLSCVDDELYMRWGLGDDDDDGEETGSS